MPLSDSLAPSSPVPGSRTSVHGAVLPPLLLVATAAWWVFGYMAPGNRPGAPSYDIFNAYYPNLVYALRSLREGHGLLWNPLQNCGQPFLPATNFGPFYPLNLAYLLFGVDRAMQAIAFLHLVFGGLGMYLLCREIGLAPAAAFCGAISFEMGAHLLGFAGWVPVTVMGAYVWLPFALLFCERILRAPDLRGGLGLAAVLTLSILAAYPQMTMFIYQVVLLRVGFEVLVSGPRSVRPAVGILALGLALPLFLGAAHLAPAVEFAARSIRGRALTPAEVAGGPPFDWGRVRAALAPGGWYIGHNFPVTFAALAPLALAARARRDAVFYASVAVLFTALAVDGPVLRLYLSLPIGRIFRVPERSLWVASFAACMLVGLGADAIGRETKRWRAELPLLVVVGAVVLWLFAGSMPPARDAWSVAGLAGVAAVAMAPEAGPRRRLVKTAAPALLVGAYVLYLSRFLFFAYADWGALLAEDASVLTYLEAVTRTENRFYAVAPQSRPGLVEKTATLFGVPSISDYEPQTSQRFADLDVLLRTNHAMKSIDEYGLRLTRAPRNRRLLDLLATRYLVTVENGERLDPALEGSLRLATRMGDILVYENPNAFGRAFYVAMATVVPDAALRLETLAFGSLDLRRTVVLEEAPPDGFLGTSAGSGEARIDADRSERVRIHVHADAPGFLVLTDQDYPGWVATVNGTTVPTLRADHAFRAVSVPAGESTVVWEYRPRLVWLGLTTSLGTLVVVAVALARARR